MISWLQCHRYPNVIICGESNFIFSLGLGSMWAAPSASQCWGQVAGVTGRWAGEDDPPAAESTEPPENIFWDRSVSITDLVRVAKCTSAAGITGPVRRAALWGAATSDSSSRALRRILVCDFKIIHNNIQIIYGELLIFSAQAWRDSNTEIYEEKHH